MIKAVFFDVDGTLLSHKSKCIPASARDALRRLRENGIKIIMATGRCANELELLPVNDIAFDGYVIMNGQICLDSSRQLIYSDPFPPEAAQALIRLFNTRAFPMTLIEAGRIYINFVNDIALQTETEISTPVPPVGVPDGSPVFQSSIFVTQEQEAGLVLPYLPSCCRLARWHRNGTDVLSATGGKVKGIRYFQTALGLDTGEIMAFGDAENDAGMLEYAGTGVAMGNGDDIAKRAADYVTASVDDDGVLKALEHLGLI